MDIRIRHYGMSSDFVGVDWHPGHVWREGQYQEGGRSCRLGQGATTIVERRVMLGIE